jgi:3-oxoacyl-[acyl-carrier protein] reductase
MARVAVVTGGGYGIGRAVCRQLAADGWSLASFDNAPQRNAETVNLIEAAGGSAVAVDGDVTDAAAAERACSTAERRFGPLSGLVNCAAMRHPGPITEITEAQWDETVGVCLKGTFLFCKAAIPRIAAAGGGSIVNFSSSDAHGRRGMIAYATAKAAIENFTRCLAADHLAERIRVNAVIPPFTLTGMTEHYPAERLEQMAAAGVAGRYAVPDDVAHLVRFLMSDDAATLTAGIFGGTVPVR